MAADPVTPALSPCLAGDLDNSECLPTLTNVQLGEGSIVLIDVETEPEKVTETFKGA